MKNFDRAIEQRMNEQQVPPPFGAWNRIAAELDAMPVAAAEPAPVNTFIPKRAIASFIAGMLIMGTAVATGFWVNATINRDKKITSENNSVVPTSFSAGVGNGMNAITQPDMTESSPISKLPQYAPFTNRPIAHKPAPVAVSNQPEVNPDVKVNGNADVPAPIQAVSLPAGELKETYYFPPVDIITPEKCKPEVEETKIAKVDEAKVTTDDDRPKADTKKFKPHRRKGGWGYGTINRM